MTQLTPDELLKPRYMVTAPYPDNADFPVGSIIQGFKPWPNENGSYWQYTVKDCKGKREWLSDFFDLYPHLFKKLKWWDNRNYDEMPEYVKCGAVVRKVFMHFAFWNGSTWIHDNSRQSFVSENETFHYNSYIPATEEQYLKYINSKQ